MARIGGWWWVTALALAACASGADAIAGSEDPGPGRSDAPLRPVADSVFAFVDVRVLPMDVERELLHQTVVVRDGTVAEIGPATSTAVPPGATRIEGAGRTLLPGLADMHVHLRTADAEAYVRNGITTVRNMWGYPGLRDIVADIASGALVGPTVFSTSPGLDGTPAKWPYTQIVMDPAKADSVVAAQQAAGWETLKLYSDLRPEVYDSIVAAARRRDMDYVGHVPGRIPVEHVLEAGQRSIEHLGGYQFLPDGDRLRALYDLTVEVGAWNCPTLAVQLQVGPARTERRRAIVKGLHDAGAPLLVGTDSGIDLTEPGTSIHVELAELVRSGLSPFEALTGATRDAARFLGRSEVFGQVRAGARADLLLVGGNPLRDLGVLAEPVGVMLRGAWIRLDDVGG